MATSSAISTLINYSSKFSNSYKKYNFKYDKEKHYLFVKDQNEQLLFYETPFLKVYRNVHQHQDKWYIVLEITDEDIEDDSNNEIHNFKSMLDKIYGQSHEFIRKNFSDIFPKAQGIIDKYTLDTCIIRPFAGSNGQFIKILIPTEELALKANDLKEGQYISCRFLYNGLLKMKGGKLLEEYVLNGIYTYEEWTQDQIKKNLNERGTKLDIEIIKDNEEEIENKDVFVQSDIKDEEKEIIKINNEEVNENIEVESIINEEEIKDLENEKEEESEKIEDEVSMIHLSEQNFEKDENNRNVNYSEENKIEYMEGSIEHKEKNKKDKNKKEKKELKESKSKNRREKEKEKNKKDKMKKKISKNMKKNKNEESSSNSGGSDTESDKDNLSDNEEFHNLDSEMKKLIRKFR